MAYDSSNVKTHSNMTLIKRFVPYFSNYKSILFFDLFCASLTTVNEMVLPLILRYLTNTGMEDISLITLSTIGKLGALFFVLKIIDVLSGYYMQKTGHIMGAKIETDMRKDVFNHLHKLSDSYFNDTKVGQIMTRITNDLFDVTEFAHHCPEEYFIGAIKIIVSFILLININVPLTLVIFAIIPMMIIASGKYRKRMRKSFKAQRNHIGEINSQIEDSLLGVKVVKSFTNEEQEIKKFEEGNQEFLDIKKETYTHMAGYQMITKIFDGLMYLAVIVFGGIFMMRGTLLPGDLVAYVLFVNTLLATVRRIVEFAEQFQRGMTGIERFTELMDQDIEIFDEPDAVELKDVKGDILVDHVTFKYHDNDDIILDDITLNIEHGANVALVGPSGGGKTTLCNLIPRFYDVTDGRITIDGKDIRGLTLKSLRSNIGMVQQDVYLFSGTVLDNIEYGKPGASKEDIIKAAKLAGAYDFIMGLPKGFDTYVGERGVKLSGGQKQRISIARVFLKNPPILILDEATSALDNRSEKIIQKSLEKLAKGRTTLTIAHRLTTIQNADKIIVLTEDGIVEEGNHKELMKKKGYYYNLYTQGNMDLNKMGLDGFLDNLVTA
ncbi:ABC transporter ATP-binding protein [Miniphocaeibacter halophilus]|uniref:ABC transporter ATP-binding protein n=1 Tax=Miniphocaeibacter halophilus TaxID=2931922 RepID=A0AC61MWM0_9FIRM|nr:ABC transporter ATP-binding protein [Miniphocaeibacter halophilus]QQK08490.1 ABC transporter ATP-binding protein [Miniphocaeibacter halophilus]